MDNLELTNSLTYIERSYRNILQLKNRLNSYSYEPRTYSLFEQFEQLKLQLELLSISHLKLMSSLKKPIDFIEIQMQQIKENVNAARLLELNVSEYISLAK